MLNVDDLIKIFGKIYANSTIWCNFKKLSSPMGELGNHCYINIEVIKNNRGRPTLRGRLSETASEALSFRNASSSKSKPPSCILKNIGKFVQVEIPPLSAGDKYVSPKDMITLSERLIGKDETSKRLMRLLKTDVSGKDRSYTERAKILVSEHKVGPYPKRIRFTNPGLIELYANEQHQTLCADMILSPAGTLEDDLKLLEVNNMAICPTCRRVTGKSARCGLCNASIQNQRLDEIT